MIKFNYKIVINLFIILIILLIGIYVYLKSSIYNNLVILDDKEQVIQYSIDSIPVKVELYSKRWGKLTIDSNEQIKEFWNIVDGMPKSNNFYNSKIENSFNEITGTIYYLDGKKGTLYLNDTLRIDDIYYGGNDSSAYINRIKNYINDIFCTPSVLSKLINDKNKITIVDTYNNIKKCGSNDKLLLKDEIMNLKRIKDNKKLEWAVANKGDLNCHIRIYRDEFYDNKIEDNINNYDVISLDIYENNYVIVRDYGDEIVNSFYMEGNLNNICDNLFNQ
ncbi:DUF3919 family protein [Clostridium taeniosporum]|uniref:DUF3919 domain-containing protein n=1 Tax=Clostridium taeniosporum TaxID=394958 RepID=A0A1D7XGQ7_9CLOT|nr:DUF3919 family protein [Clostridium taeniosporum]AOR22526.1 DUF3919 domain-containing protein [Clostridium taeniosporum]